MIKDPIQYNTKTVKMPSLQKFHANVARHVKLMNKNLCANLIRHDYIVTGRTKAKRAQAEIERFLGRALQENKKMADKDEAFKLENMKSLRYLQPPDKKEVGSKIFNELAERYSARSHGFTRIIKLEPRLGEDKAPMSVLELVDSNFEIKFWYTAKIVARLELQNLPLDELTQHNVKKLTQLRNDGEEKFREAVETAKVQFFEYDPESGEVLSSEMEENLSNMPPDLRFYGSKDSGLTASKKFKTVPRLNKNETIEIPKSPFLSS